MECILKLFVLDKKPKRVRIKELFYYITRPMAKLIYKFDKERQKEITFKRNFIATLNKRDFINEVAKCLYDEVQTRGTIRNEDEPLCKVLCREEAKEIFEQKKQNGYFDELNVMI